MSWILLDIYWLISLLISAYISIIVISAIISWLVLFNAVNPRNPGVQRTQAVFYNLTEPALRPIRRFLPDLGGLDISPIILIVGLMFLDRVLGRLVSALIGRF